MPMRPSQEQIDAFDRCIRRMQDERGPAQFELNWPCVVALVSHLQLALRHPGTGGTSTRMVRAWLEALFLEVQKIDPELAGFLRMGDDPRHDVLSK